MLQTPPSVWPKLHIVHCGVEPELYQRPKTNKAHQLLFVGRLVAAKGISILLTALARARRVQPALSLILAGDGPDRSTLQAQAHLLGLDDCVSFIGYQDQEQIAELLSGSAALVLPSFAEGVPIVLMEAMASGVPVVSTHIAGIPELVQDGKSGRLVPPGDEDALAQAILEVTDGSTAEMGAAGQAQVRAHFDVREEAARLAQLLIWSQTHGPRPPRRPDGAGPAIFR